MIISRRKFEEAISDAVEKNDKHWRQHLDNKDIWEAIQELKRDVYYLKNNKNEHSGGELNGKSRI